jgi:hypothetical protein
VIENKAKKFDKICDKNESFCDFEKIISVKIKNRKGLLP